MKNIIFEISGGIGKNIMATAVIKAIKKHRPEDNIIVTTAWDKVFTNNPDVHRVYNLNNMNYFYDDYIKDKEIEIFAHEPYKTADFIQKKKHLIEIWCDMCNVPYDNETPEIFINERELYQAKLNIKSEKPILVLQTNGGTPVGDTGNTYSWTRDVPVEISQKLVNVLAEKYNIIHIKYPKQQALEKTTPFYSENLRDLFTLIKISEKRILIDSFAQHTSKALGLQSTVLWPIDNLKTLGYDSHINITSEQGVGVKSHSSHYLSDNDISGAVFDNCPFDNIDTLFDVNNIITQSEDKTIDEPVLNVDTKDAP
jgi:hypothetical protein